MKTNDTYEASVPGMDDIVFENRNKDYGAYVLRRTYGGNVLIGMVLMLTVTTFILLQPVLSKLFADAEQTEVAPPKKLVYSELSVPPSIDKPKPPPSQVALPKLQKTIKFVPPKVVKETVSEEVPTLDEIKQNEISTETVETDEIVFDEPAVEVVEEQEEIFTVVEQQPEFEGGYEALAAFLKTNMRYPASARRMAIDGTVHVSFLVSKTGDVSEVKVLRGIMAECDAEAIRVVQMMPKWKPGMQNGHPVYVRMVMPLKFRLN